MTAPVHPGDAARRALVRIPAQAGTGWLLGRLWSVGGRGKSATTCRVRLDNGKFVTRPRDVVELVAEAP